MEHIKCRYYCSYCTNENDNEDYGRIDRYCDDYIDHCEWYVPSEEDVVFTPCLYYETRYGEFEKNAKSYAYDGGELTLRGISLEEDEIEYLEIDGRVLVNKEDPT